LVNQSQKAQRSIVSADTTISPHPLEKNNIYMEEHINGIFPGRKPVCIDPRPVRIAI
jgi:hypothetical protein